MKELNVLSLFGGMECGRQALKDLDVKPENYYSSEVDKYAIKIADKNHSDIIQIGDVRDISYHNGTLFTPYGEYQVEIDLMMGGSPCQNFSFAGKQAGASTRDRLEIHTLDKYLKLKAEGFEFEGQSYLFWEFMRLLKEVDPTYFLLENVNMSKKWEAVLTDAIGVDPIKIDSALVSAQSRVRLYWTNIEGVTQPEDKGVSITDILEKDKTEHKYYSSDSGEYTNYDKSKVDKSINKITPIQIGNSRQFGNAVRNNNKAYTLRASNCNGILNEDYLIRKYTPVECERLQTLPDKYTEGVSNTQRYKMIGNGWTVDVISHILSFIKQGESD